MSNKTNTINAEAYQVEKAETTLKGKILKMLNSVDKQAEWKKNFGTVVKADDSFLAGNIF